MTFGELLCDGLPTSPGSSRGKVLVAGAGGYVGGRLVRELLARGYKVRCMVRGRAEAYRQRWPEAEVVEADALKAGELGPALRDVDTAFYLIHSLLADPGKPLSEDIRAAVNFSRAASAAGARRIIYLGKLADMRSPAGSPQADRATVAEKLAGNGVPVTALRADLIIGPGSASFSILSGLAQKLPLVPIPPWAANRQIPIAIRDVVRYLVGCLEAPESTGNSYEIGGGQYLSYAEMLKVMCQIAGRKPRFVSFPLRSISFYAYAGSLLTPVPHEPCLALLRSIRFGTGAIDDTIRNLIPFKTLSFRDAAYQAYIGEKRGDYYSRWSDSWPPAHELDTVLDKLGHVPVYTARYQITTGKPAPALFASVCKVGGEGGWLQDNWMWKLRGGIDRLLKGVGSSRGRKEAGGLCVNDVIDFWRVEDVRKDRRLLLRAEMRVPGKAWLEFRIEELDGSRLLSAIAYYDTGTVYGKSYWYAFRPFHNLIFKRLLRGINERSAGG